MATEAAGDTPGLRGQGVEGGRNYDAGLVIEPFGGDVGQRQRLSRAGAGIDGWV